VQSTPEQKRRSVILVFCCTLIGAAAQVFFKNGANHLASGTSFVETAVGLLTNVELLTALSLYAINTLLLVLALRHSELSLLYPVIAMTYVWVTILSKVVFHEELNVWKLAGIAVIITGVAILGRGNRA
jgi:multidrug transporter EmrE-like cation transporter